MNTEKVKRAMLATQRHSWEQGVAMQALLETGDTELMIAMAFESVNRAMEDGRAATIGVTDGVTDPCCVGEALKLACELTDDPFLCRGRRALLEWALRLAPRNREGIVYHLTRTREFWADSFYMLPPYLAAEGYYEEALKQWNGYWEALYDPAAGLVRHMWNDEAQKFTRDAHWGIGNGWALASIARMMGLLPKTGFEKERKELGEKGLALLETLLKYETAEGYFHDVVDDKTTFQETNLSQLAAYTIYRGMKQGWLPQTMEQDAKRLRTAVWKKVNDYGFVKDVCGAPTFDKPGYSPEAQAFCLMMEQAAKEWRR